MPFVKFGHYYVKRNENILLVHWGHMRASFHRKYECPTNAQAISRFEGLAYFKVRQFYRKDKICHLVPNYIERNLY